MVFEVCEVGGIGEFEERKDESGRYFAVPGGKVFVVVRANTIEVRTDERLGRLLREKYDAVMESRYFGRGGIEVVMSGQLSEEEVKDLVRLSYNLTREMAS